MEERSKFTIYNVISTDYPLLLFDLIVKKLTPSQVRDCIGNINIFSIYLVYIVYIDLVYIAMLKKKNLYQPSACAIDTLKKCRMQWQQGASCVLLHA